MASHKLIMESLFIEGGIARVDGSTDWLNGGSFRGGERY